MRRNLHIFILIILGRNSHIFFLMIERNSPQIWFLASWDATGKLPNWWSVDFFCVSFAMGDGSKPSTLVVFYHHPYKWSTCSLLYCSTQLTILQSCFYLKKVSFVEKWLGLNFENWTIRFHWRTTQTKIKNASLFCSNNSVNYSKNMKYKYNCWDE